MKFRPVVCFSLLLPVMAGTAFAASGPWNATWQLNAAKSETPGPTFVVTKTGDGAYQMEMPGSKYTFRCDGKDYPTKGSASIECKEKNDREMDVFMKSEGALTSTAHRTISKDGKTQTVETVLHATPGRVADSPDSRGAQDRELRTDVYRRVSDSTGFVGAWKVVNDGRTAGPVLETSLTKTTFEMNYTDRRQDIVAKLEGSDTPIHTAHGTVTMSVKADGPMQMDTTTKAGGNIVMQGTLTISDDKKTLTEEQWRPEKPQEKTRKVYDRQ